MVISQCLFCLTSKVCHLTDTITIKVFYNKENQNTFPNIVFIQPDLDKEEGYGIYITFLLKEVSWTKAFELRTLKLLILQLIDFGIQNVSFYGPSYRGSILLKGLFIMQL